MKAERLLPLILVVIGAVVFFSAYQKKTTVVQVPSEFKGNRAVELFYEHQCYTCHTVSALPNARGHLGPGLDDIGSRAPGYDAQGNGEDYIRESILQPAKVVREGFINGMPSFADKMTDEELTTLVEWLASLKESSQKSSEVTER